MLSNSPMLANLVLDLFLKGGLMMWPLLLCLIAAAFVVLERSLWWWRLRRCQQPEKLAEIFQCLSTGSFQRALEVSESTQDPHLKTLAAGLRQAHASMLGAMQLYATEEVELAEKRQWILGTLITLAPLLGLMGTVTGIMHSFHFVGSDELAAVKVSGGIAEALIATACGLGIAILSLLPYNFFNRCLSQFRSTLERSINHAELLIQSAKAHGHDVEHFARTLESAASVSIPHVRSTH